MRLRPFCEATGACLAGVHVIELLMPSKERRQFNEQMDQLLHSEQKAQC